MITLDGNGNLFDIEVGGTRLTPEFVQQNSIEIFAFRIVLTAGLAIPTIQMIVGSTNEAYLRKFKETNDVTVYVGSSPDSMDSFDMDVVGHHIKYDGQTAKFILNCGGTLKKDKLSSMFLKDKLDGIYTGNAMKCLRTVWNDLVGTGIDSDSPEDSKDISRQYKRNNRTLQNYLADIFLHIDITPSFPMITIDRKGRLKIRDFQKQKKKGAVKTLAPSNAVSLKRLEIPYIGKPVTMSYKTYTNRACGYTQIITRNVDTGELKMAAANLSDSKEGWALNTLATTADNESSYVEHRMNNIHNAVINDETDEDYHKVALFNKNHLINMSSIQTIVRSEGRYINEVDVLDIVNLNTKIREDKMSGLYIVEALQIGFVQGAPFTTVFHLCRDNENDVESTVADPYNRSALKALNINPSTKADIINACRKSRQALINTRQLINGTYLREWQTHLIGTRNAALTNFSLFGTRIDLASAAGRARSMQNMTSRLWGTFINKFIPEPFKSQAYTMGLGDSGAFGLILTFISALFGADLYNAVSGLFFDLQTFNNFFQNYHNTVTYVQAQQSPFYVEQFYSGDVTFTESSSGNLIMMAARTPTLAEFTGETMTITDDEKSKILASTVASITSNIPTSVDIPIPEIKLTDSDALRPKEELKEYVVDQIVDDLINKGYVYNDLIVNPPVGSSIGVMIMKPDGTMISTREAADTMVSSTKIKSILMGTSSFDAESAKRIENTVGETINVRHWGTFSDYNELSSFNVLRGFVDKYKTVNTVKRLSAQGGKRIYVALPASETNVKFYINSEQVTMGEMEVAGLGYYDSRNREIPYVIYFTYEGYNSSNVMIELRKGL
jgi:hypothetical protein